MGAFSMRPEKNLSVLFDFDGTLIDSAPSLLSSFSKTLEMHGILPVCSLQPNLIGPPLKKILNTISGCDDDAILEELAATFRNEYDESGYKFTTAYDGIEQALRSLVENKVKLYLVTNKRELPTLKILEMLGWGELFCAVYTIDAPNGGFVNKADAISNLIKKYELVLNESIYVGDTDGDRIAAEINGMKFISVSWGYGIPDGDISYPLDLNKLFFVFP